MLIGEHLHTLDQKRRVSMPAKFRKVLGKSVIVTRGLDGSLFVFSTQQWKEVAGKMEQLSMGSKDARSFARFMLGGASETPFDSLGRILIPEYLARYAGLGEEATIIGVYTRAEIWEPKRFEAYKEKVVADADTLAERLSSIGAL